MFWHQDLKTDLPAGSGFLEGLFHVKQALFFVIGLQCDGAARWRDPRLWPLRHGDSAMWRLAGVDRPVSARIIALSRPWATRGLSRASSRGSMRIAGGLPRVRVHAITGIFVLRGWPCERPRHQLRNCRPTLPPLDPRAVFEMPADGGDSTLVHRGRSCRPAQRQTEFRGLECASVCGVTGMYLWCIG
jgi:hypothetical protein